MLAEFNPWSDNAQVRVASRLNVVAGIICMAPIAFIAAIVLLVIWLSRNSAGAIARRRAKELAEQQRRASSGIPESGVEG